MYFKKVFSHTVDFYPFVLYNKSCPRGVAQLGARVVWDHEVAGSIPVTPTKKSCLMTTLFLLYIFNALLCIKLLLFHKIIDMLPF
jgi:hypothetical protein